MIYISNNEASHNFPIFKGYKELRIGNFYDNKYKDNIEHLNPYLNEYTALYLMWKHIDDEIVGLSHYRRFFTMNGYFLKWNEACSILNEVDIICTYDYKVWNGIYANLRSEMWSEGDRLIFDKYCNFLFAVEPGLKDWFINSKGFNPRNMFVCRKSLIDKYFEWIFPIIIPWAERFVKEDLNNTDNKRILAYIVERCFGYWIQKNNLRTYRLDYFQIDQSWTEE